MNQDFLQQRLHRVARRHLWMGLGWKLAACWAITALVAGAMVWVQRTTGWVSPLTLPLIAGLATTLIAGVVIRHYQRPPDLRWVATEIEKAHPDLDGLLLTAMQQDLKPGVEPTFLQHRVMQAALARSQQDDWLKVVPARRLWLAHGTQAVALLGFIVALVLVARIAPVKGSGGDVYRGEAVQVTPGDTSIERGDSLVVLARFGKTLPPGVSLVVRENGAADKAIPLVKSLADPVFGGSVPDVANDLRYHLEYAGQRTREFKVQVFEHPRLVRSDADLTFPAYTKLASKHIEDTRRVSAVEGSQLALTLQLNKPVASAKLVARDKAKTEVPLKIEAGKAVATLATFSLATTQTYDLKLVDLEGRTNKVAAPFFIDVLKNRVPELHLTSPRGDVRPSPLEEIAFEGTVFDDFGIPAYGLTYTVAGGETKTIALGRDVGAKEKKPFSYILRLEELGTKPDDLVSWYVWADDVGPDGKIRRTQGDLYFGEVRPFDQIYRESQQQQSPDQQQGQGQGGETRKLAEMQKQIISATWKLQRDGATPSYAEDEKVVRESQQDALAQAREAMEKAQSPREQGLWGAVAQEMVKALDKLKDAAVKPEPLAEALPPEQAAYQGLLKMQAREMQIARGRSGGGGGGGANQREIDQLDLTQEENRYETQKQASAPQSPQRREQLQVMNRLQELARRQQDLNDRLKELQTALQEAKTEQEKEDVKRRLKRLQEEQQQMLADVDEVRQRMERPENQSNMAPERQQLEQTRDDVQKAADAAGQGSVPQALAAGTRAQRSLQQLRDDFRKDSSSQFSDEMRDLRNQARELSNQQEQINQKLEQAGGTQHRSLGDATDNKELVDQLAQQKERENKLVDRAMEISQQAETSEPLLSRQLEESLRKLTQDDVESVKNAKQQLLREGQMTRDLADQLQEVQDAEGNGKSLDLTSTLLRQGNLPQARDAGRRARTGIDELRRGVERAAENVLGDDTEQLKLAQSELDQLTEQLQREATAAQGADPKDQPGQSGARGNPPREGQTTPPGTATPRDRQVADANAPKGDSAQPGRDPSEPPSAEQPAAQPGGDTPGAQPGQAGQAGSRGGRRGGQVAQGGNQPGEAQARDGQSGRGGLDLGAPTNVGNDANGGAGGIGAWRDNGGGPLTGTNFAPWLERLRDVQTLLDAPELHNSVATVVERMRLMRLDYAQKKQKPDWGIVQLQILKPLVEVRTGVAEELARRDTRDPLAPIDRDPVPSRFAESVRRYYEELGKDKPDTR